MEKHTREYNKIAQDIIDTVLDKKLKYTRPQEFREYFSLSHDQSTLDGSFTSEELRIIADGMDLLRKRITKS